MAPGSVTSRTSLVARLSTTVKWSTSRSSFWRTQRNGVSEVGADTVRNGLSLSRKSKSRINEDAIVWGGESRTDTREKGEAERADAAGRLL
jgi:hypothetical protein